MINFVVKDKNACRKMLINDERKNESSVLII